jgi:hypothetical protein
MTWRPPFLWRFRVCYAERFPLALLSTLRREDPCLQAWG